MRKAQSPIFSTIESSSHELLPVLSSTQIRTWDQFTIQKESIDSIDLMERASLAFCEQLFQLYPTISSVVLFCGPGNNGGDGLAIARLLHQRALAVEVYCCEIGNSKSPDYQVNLERLQTIPEIPIHFLEEGDRLPELPPSSLLIDAIFGSGLNRAVTGYWDQLIQHLNEYLSPIVAVDIPSGLFSDQLLAHSAAIRATDTISFQVPKLSFFLPELGPFTGQWHIIDIGLHPQYLKNITASKYCLTANFISTLLEARPAYSHKGSFGHALIVAGSKGMMGAAQLAAKACLRSGVGLLTTHIPQIAYQIMQIALPEAMVHLDQEETHFSTTPNLERYTSIGVGPGLGQHKDTLAALKDLLIKAEVPLVIDADALNLIAQNPAFLDLVPKQSILTPHPGEFRRLFGASKDSLEAIKVALDIAKAKQIFIVLKGAFTRIVCPDGNLYFNSTGNPGMATAGSGDTLTGILVGLLSQGYSSKSAAVPSPHVQR